MDSTYLSYRVYAANFQRTEERIASLPRVSREAEYYEKNIGNVKSVDDLLGDRRLFAYVMRAHGLEDQIDSTALMRAVLESDLNDPTSFARTQNNIKYVSLVRSFNFNTDGDVSANQSIAQSDSQEADTIALYSEHRIRAGQAAAAEVSAYQAAIGTVTTVDEFIANEQLFNFALNANGIDARYASEATIRDVLTSDLSDVNSRANQLGGAYVDLAAAFQFQTDGTLAAGTSAQADTAVTDTILKFYQLGNNGDTPQAAAFRAEVYQTAVQSITNVDDLLADAFLVDVSLTAAGFDPDIMDLNYIRDVLVSDLSDPTSVANESGDERFVNLAQLFNFDADGGVTSADGVQSATQRTETVDLYVELFDDEIEARETRETEFFADTVTRELESGQNATVEFVDELLRNTRLVEYIRLAYDISEEDARISTLNQILRSDPADPRSFANSQGDERFERLAAAFNFGANGDVSTPFGAQGIRDTVDTVRLYNASFTADELEADNETITAENEFYNETIKTIDSVDELVEDDRLTTYVLKAFGLADETVTDTTLKLVLTSDVNDPNSFVNELEDARYVDLARAFNFAEDGTAARIPDATAQSRREIARTSELFLLQEMEAEAGQQNEGARLALYFRRRAEEIRNPFDILADVDMMTVVSTGLGLGDSFGSASLSAQVRILENRLDFADLKDPEKVDEFLIRFGSFYDQANQTAGTSTEDVLFGSSSSFGISSNLLASLQILSIR